ncbi:MAG: hypothetical protein NC202_13400 [Roseburia sp.]|nr:hypothetical protein [Roseburia sp.]
MLAVVEYTDGGLTLVVVDLERDRLRPRAILLDLPEYLLTIASGAVVIIERNTDDAENPAVERGAAGLLRLRPLTISGGTAGLSSAAARWASSASRFSRDPFTSR